MPIRSLRELLDTWKTAVAGTDLPQPPDYDGLDVGLTHLTEKTSEVSPGACFVARVRETSDGHPYINKAIENGAVMILAQYPPHKLDIRLPANLVYLEVPDTALAQAWLAAAWEGFPSRDLVVIGITGTDGKTSTANMLYSILHEAGYQTGLLSTIKAVFGANEEPLELHVTTPEAPVIQSHLRRMVDDGITHCILEATSHGLAQFRVAAVDFDLAVVTNITHEHLDYHGNFDRYFAAKARLFKYLAEERWPRLNHNPFKQQMIKTAVLNRDDLSYAWLAAYPYDQMISYGLSQSAAVTADDVSFSASETRFTLVSRQIEAGQAVHASGSIEVASALAGVFNIQNMLAAAATALALGIDLKVIGRGLHAVEVISGRMERINGGQNFQVIVDFAHTPNALEKAIEATRGLSSGRIITVFGSAGKRDVQKRRLMAAVSARTADLTILTAEDPRTESLAEILEVMAEGCRSEGGLEGTSFWRQPDRGRAIYFALSLAQPEDVVLICGKGHEQSMCFGSIEFPWDDRQVTLLALEKLLSGQPMPNTGLPTYNHSAEG